MNERLFFLTYKLPSVFIGVAIVVTSFFLVAFAQGCIKAASIPTSRPNTSTYYSDSQIAFVAGADEAMHELGQSLGRSMEVTKGGLAHAGSSIVTVGRAIASIVQATVMIVGHVCMAIISAAAHTVVFIFKIPIYVYEAISNTKVVNAVIKPADHMHGDDVPIIDPNDPALEAAKKALPAVMPTAEQAPQEAQWPIHGEITTYFGEKGRYYHPTHTGIDISDGQPSGVTPIHPFRSGKVIVVTRTSGLGNHVIIDHGNGITSVYGHMYSVAVKEGQDVDTSTVLGREGTTGVSTGPHLHFEIRVNGQATDPRGFIAGRP
jgi:hypothetical protein